jgi:hypothetical protein
MIKLKFNKTIILVIITLIIGLSAGAGIVFLINQQDVQNIISKEEAGEKIINFAKQQLPPETTISLVEVIAEKGLYKITINIQGEEMITYLTKDGSLFFPQVLDLTVLLATPPTPTPGPTPEQEIQFTQEQLAGLAKCLTEKGVIFYGTHWCGFCDRQKKMFGEAAKYLPYIECAPEQATEAELAQCREAGVGSIPDWRFPDGRQELGMLPLEKLVELSECSL